MMDTKTLLIAAALTIVVNGWILFLIQSLLPRAEQASARVWQLGSMMIAAGCVAFSFKSELPQIFERTLPNALIMLGLTLYWHSVRQLCGQPSRLAVLVTPVVLATAGVYLFHVVYPDPWTRILIIASVWMLMLFGSAMTLSRHSGRDTPASQRTLTWLFCAVGLYALARLLLYSQVDFTPDFDPTDNKHWATRLSPLLAFLLPVVGSTAFVLLCYERVRRKSLRQIEALGYISHDLRAPALTIKGYIDLLLPFIPLSQAAHVQAIQRSSEYQMSLIDELLEYAAQDLKPLELKPVSTGLDAFVKGVLEQGQILCRQQDNRFVVRCSSPLPAHILVDARRLSQVLLNLISNAAAFTRCGTIVLALSCKGEGSHSLLTFAIQDSGPGVPLQRQAKIFDAFEQDQRRNGSVGLGLHIARNIVQNMGGALQLESAPEAGSRFSFDIRVPVLSIEVFRPMWQADGEMPPAPLSDVIGDVVAPVSVHPHLEELVQYAKWGEISRIEQWLVDNRRRYPDAEAFFKVVEYAAARLDLAGIEQLASVDTADQPL